MILAEVGKVMEKGEGIIFENGQRFDKLNAAAQDDSSAQVRSPNFYKTITS